MRSRRFADFLAKLRGAGGGREGQRDRTRFAAVLDLNRSLAEAPDRKTVLQLLLDEAVELFRAERGFLIEFEPGADSGFSVALARSLDREPVRQPLRKISTTVIGQCRQTREGVFVEDAQEGALGAAQSIADMQLRSVLCIPLLAGGELYGCLYLDHRFHKGAFRAADIPWAQALADQGAIALRLYGLLALQDESRRAVERENVRLADSLAAREAAAATGHDADATRADLEHAYDEIVGRSPALLRMLRLLDRIAAVDFAVLLVGDSGTGKELVARAIHRYGRRSSGAFVAVNVAAVSPAILESELFGHVSGAFTGAEQDRLGLIRHANGGVLFLDEVTEMPLEMQVKLLRFLEDHRVRPVGSDAMFEVDLRVVAATNCDPQQAVAEGRLREDLYYRLSAMTVAVPSLRERLDDVPLLVEHFLEIAARERDPGAAEVIPKRATPGLLEALRRRTWSGNLRQLRNEVFRLDALVPGDALGPDLLEREGDVAPASRETLDLRTLERWAIDEALRLTAGNKAEAARLLGISRRALYNKLGRD